MPFSLKINWYWKVTAEKCFHDTFAILSTDTSENPPVPKPLSQIGEVSPSLAPKFSCFHG